MPIRALSNFSGSGWCIEARVISKSCVRKFRKTTGEGRFFKIELSDRDGSEITATFFGSAVDRFFDTLKLLHVFLFSRGVVKAANNKYDRGRYILTFGEHSAIQPTSDDGQIPGLRHNFVPLEQVEKFATNMWADIKGVIVDVRGPSSVTIRSTGDECMKRDVVLWDDSGRDASTCVAMTLWGNPAGGAVRNGAILFARAARVSEWHGAKSLNSGDSCSVDPADEEAEVLRRKYHSSGGVKASLAALRMPLVLRQTLQEIQEENKKLAPPAAIGSPIDPQRPKATHFHVVVAVLVELHLGRAPFYLSCPWPADYTAAVGFCADDTLRLCQKKVVEQSGLWRCDKGHMCSQPLARYFFRARIADHTGFMDVTFFDDAASEVLGCKASDFAALWEDTSRGHELLGLLGSRKGRRLQLRLRSSLEVWQDTERVRVVVEDALPVNVARLSRLLLADLQASLVGGSAPAA